MKYCSYPILIFLSLFLFFSFHVFGLDVPFLSGRVIDEAHLFSSESKVNLEKELQGFEEKTSNQIVVLTIPSLEGGSLEDYSIRVVETWKLGQKSKNNGVLLLIVKDDRQLRIEVGYGLEGVLTDAVSHSIIRNQIVPYFKSGNFDGGVLAGVRSIMQATQGEYQASKSDSTAKNDSDLVFLPFFYLFILAFFILTGWLAKRGKHHGWYWGGGGGGFSGGGWSSGGGGFSGGGGSFGGGGSSGRW